MPSTCLHQKDHLFATVSACLNKNGQQLAPTRPSAHNSIKQESWRGSTSIYARALSQKHFFTWATLNSSDNSSSLNCWVKSADWHACLSSLVAGRCSAEVAGPGKCSAEAADQGRCSTEAADQSRCSAGSRPRQGEGFSRPRHPGKEMESSAPDLKGPCSMADHELSASPRKLLDKHDRKKDAL